jgi:hypothetical protein
MIKVLRNIFLSFLIFSALAASIVLAVSVISQHMPMVDGASYAKAWLDSNGDGVWDATESPLQGVCMWSYTGPEAYDEVRRCQYDISLTNDQGIWPGDFHAGARSGDIYIFTDAPMGYRSTTPPAVHASYAEFGFAPTSISIKNPVGSRYEYVKAAIWNNQVEPFLKIATGLIGIGLLICLSVILSIRINNAWSRNRPNK